LFAQHQQLPQQTQMLCSIGTLHGTLDYVIQDTIYQESISQVVPQDVQVAFTQSETAQDVTQDTVSQMDHALLIHQQLVEMPQQTPAEKDH